MKKSKNLPAPKGFSLIEMAVVIAIMGILMTFGIKLATSYQNKGAFSATADRQNEIKDTLSVYLGKNGRLPCPADPAVSSGLEEPIDGPTCTIKRGLVPFQTLGLARSTVIDGWDRYFTYSVWDDTDACGEVFTNTEKQNWADVTNIPTTTINTYHDGGDGCLIINEDGVNRRFVAALVSHGPNGFGGYNSKGSLIDSTEAELEEVANLPSTASNDFVSLPINLDGFDDIVMAITADDLLIPLKKSGAIVSVSELERQHLYTLFEVNPTTCEISTKSSSEGAGGEALKLSYNSASIIISPNQYCPGITSFSSPPPP